MTFNKTQYWKNRNEGKRGQGDVAAPEAPADESRHAHGKHMVQAGRGFTFVNRAQARRKLPAARIFYGPDDKIGKKDTAKGAVRPQFSHEHHLDRVRDRAAA